MPLFSIILATRDRPVLFKEALDSVLAQDFVDFEIVVVNDGSSEHNLADYQILLEQAAASVGERLRSYSLIHRPRGHGQSYSLNFGVSHASGEYVCFLDDDDTWTDPGHLARAARAINEGAKRGEKIDLYMGNQKAYLYEREVAGPLWLSALASEMKGRGAKPDADGVFNVAVADLMESQGFCHLNCFIVRRALYEEIGGMDEGIRWECDRDVFLRLVDKSGCMLHHPAYVSHHNVPDPKKSLNMTTALSMLEKRLLQVRVLDKAALLSAHPLIRAHGRQHKAYALKKIAEELAGQRNWLSARHYAAQALGAAPTLKWLVFTIYCGMRSLANAGK